MAIARVLGAEVDETANLHAGCVAAGFIEPPTRD